jgi:hypothetical protein
MSGHLDEFGGGEDPLWDLLNLTGAPSGSSTRVPHAVAVCPALRAPTLRELREQPLTEDTEGALLMPGSLMPGPDPETLLNSPPPGKGLEEGPVVQYICKRVRDRSPRKREFLPGVTYYQIKASRYEWGVWRHFSKESVSDLCKDRMKQIIDAKPELNFKIGLTTDCESRLDRYEQEGARILVAVHQTDSIPDAVYFERCCIGHFSSHVRCRNKAPGGEGMNRGVSPVFLYVTLGGPPRASNSDSTWLRLQTAPWAKTRHTATGPKSATVPLSLCARCWLSRGLSVPNE